MMAFLLLVQQIIAVAVINYGFHASHVEAKSQKFPRESFQEIESFIKQELEAFSEEDLAKESKLRSTLDSGPSSLVFYPTGKKASGKYLFTWKVKDGKVPNIIIMGSRNVTNSSDSEGEWMAGTFAVLKRGASAEPSSKDEAYFHALIAYVRKDSTGMSVEWDHWSQRTVQRLAKKESEIAAEKDFSVDTVLCAYGTCPCLACQCGKDGQSEVPGKHHVDNSRGTEDNDETSTETETTAASKGKPLAQKPKKKGKNFYGAANAIGHSKRGSTYSSAIAKGQGAARAVSFADNGTAVSESHAAGSGQSLSFSKGRATAFSEANSGTGGAKSLAVSNQGLAQSQASSRGGIVEAKAANLGGNDTRFANYDDDAPQDFDAPSLVADTDKVFAQVQQRSQLAKIRTKGARVENMCLKEYDIDAALTLEEWESLLKKSKIKTELEKYPKPLQGGSSFRYKNPLRYGIDIDLGVNCSLVIATKYSGVAPEPGFCCRAPSNSSAVVDFLTTMNQSCNSDLEEQLERVDLASTEPTLSQLLQTKKLTGKQIKDLTPMILWKVYKNEETHSSMEDLRNRTNGTASPEIYLMTSLIAQGVQFAVTEGHNHKVKILKELEKNVRSMWAGVMLEFKGCVVQEKTCDAKYMAKLRFEKQIILGLYIFLRFADARMSSVAPNGGPVQVFYSFMQLHYSAIAKLSYCKSRKVLMNALESKYKVIPEQPAP